MQTVLAVHLEALIPHKAQILSNQSLIHATSTHWSVRNQSGYFQAALQASPSHNYQFRGWKAADGTSRVAVKPPAYISNDPSLTAFGHIRLCEPTPRAYASQDPRMMPKSYIWTIVA